MCVLSVARATAWTHIEGWGGNQDRISEGGTVSKRVPRISIAFANKMVELKTNQILFFYSKKAACKGGFGCIGLLSCSKRSFAMHAPPFSRYRDSSPEGEPRMC